MTLIVPNVGEEAFLDLLTAVGYTVHLYTAVGGSAETRTDSDFTEADFTGYSSKALTGGSWTTAQSDPSTATYAQQTFASSADQSAQTVLGYYVTLTSGGALRWYEAFSASIDVQYDGQQIRVTPRLTLADTQD